MGGLTGSAARQQGTLSGDSEEEHAPKEGGLLDWFSGGDSGGPTTSTAAASRPAGRQDQHLSSSDSLRTSKQARQRPQEDLQKDVSASIPSGVYSLERELEHLRKEISTLRYEKSEDLRSISELRGRIDVATEVHQRTISNMQEQHRFWA